MRGGDVDDGVGGCGAGRVFQYLQRRCELVDGGVMAIGLLIQQCQVVVQGSEFVAVGRKRGLR